MEMKQEMNQPSNESWRVVLFTNAPGGVVYQIVDELLRPMGHRIVGVVTSPGPKRRRSSAYQEVVAAVRHGTDVIVSNHPARWAEMIAPMQPDLIVSAAMPWRIPAEVVALPRLGAVNLHPSLLPRHRGPAPFEAVFLSDDTESGLTAHRISPEFDGGPILAQTRVPISDEDDGESLMRKIVGTLPELFRTFMDRIASGDEGEPQDESQATYAGLHDASSRTIDWNRPAREVHNLVRSWTGMLDAPKGAFGMLAEDLFVIEKTRIITGRQSPGDQQTPGTVLERTNDGIVVQCGDGPLTIVGWHAHNLESATVA